MGILRLILAYTVVFYHLGVLSSWTGPVAVCCFFVISGFYMQMLLANPAIEKKDFYGSRAFRIFPAYWLFATLDFVFAGEPHLRLLQGFSAVFIIGRDALCLANQCNVPVVPGWSLAIELYFYALAPFLLRKSDLTLLFWGLASLTINIVIVATLYNKGISLWLCALFPSTLYLFIIGALMQRVYPYITGHLFGYLLFLVCISLILSSAFALLPENEEIIIYYGVPAFTGLLTPILFYLLRHNWLDRWFGNLSYPLYLCHTVIGSWMVKTGYRNSVAIIAVITIAAIATYHFIDKPIDKLRHGLFRKKQVVVP